MCFDFRRARSHPLAPTIHRPLYRVGRQCTRQKKAMSRQRSVNFPISDKPTGSLQYSQLCVARHRPQQNAIQRKVYFDRGRQRLVTRF